MSEQDIEARIAARYAHDPTPEHPDELWIKACHKMQALCRELAGDNERIDRELLDVTAAAKFNEQPSVGDSVGDSGTDDSAGDKAVDDFENELDDASEVGNYMSCGSLVDDWGPAVVRLQNIARREHAARVKAEQDYKDALDAWEAEIKLRQELEEKVKFLRKRIANEFLRGGKLLERAEQAEAQHGEALDLCENYVKRLHQAEAALAAKQAVAKEDE